LTVRSYFLSGLLGLGVLALIALFQQTPGYMDAEYYYSGGMRLAEGYGFNEEILWNFLDDPAGIPHPSHGYWMPLVSMLAAIGPVISGGLNFAAARLPFVLLAAFLPPLTAALAWRLHRRRDLAVISAAFALFPAFYLSYLPTTDIFSPLMVIGGLFLLMIPSDSLDGRLNNRKMFLSYFILGILAGLMHLARADGVIWLFVALGASVAAQTGGPLPESQTGLSESAGERCPETRRSGVVVGVHLLACIFGYLLFMAPWFARNFTVFGTILAPGGSRALWIREYDELFSYPATTLTFTRWWGTGLKAIAGARWWAAGQNLQSAIAVQGEIFLAPLVLIGMWRLSRDQRIRLAGIAWLLIFLAMTLIFPFQGARGGFFHSAAALQPFFWAVAPLGLESLLEIGAQRRGWDIRQARRFFSTGLVVFALLLTVFVTTNRLFSNGAGKLSWNESHARYTQLEQALIIMGAAEGDVVMVNNAPGFYVASERPAISIPFGSLQDICSAAERYRVRFLCLEIDQIPGETGLFEHPVDKACLQFRRNVEGIRVFEVRAP
jgi:hypothetical protein